MKIPKKITVGEKKYKVEMSKELIDGVAVGAISFGAQRIILSTHANGKKLAQAEVSNSFWHELTHAILEDMGHDLTDNERFVRAFANKLSDAIDSAKF
jgi:hypothetical protein